VHFKLSHLYIRGISRSFQGTSHAFQVTSHAFQGTKDVWELKNRKIFGDKIRKESQLLVCIKIYCTFAAEIYRIIEGFLKPKANVIKLFKNI
jgi:hypothetical protein